MGFKENSSKQPSRYASRAEDKVAYPTRLYTSNYEALMAASSGTGVSGNNLVNEAIEHYLSSETFQKKLKTARTSQEEAIRKLSGK